MTYFDNRSSSLSRSSARSHKRAAPKHQAEILLPANQWAVYLENPAQMQAARLSKMREMLPLLITLLASRMGQRGAAGLGVMLRSLMRKVYTQEKALIIDRIKQTLRRSPDWQARVFEDLGGEAGMARWQARLMRAWTPKPEDDPDHNYDWLNDDPEDWPVIEAPAPRTRKTCARRKGLLTDRDGVFRWEKIKLGRDSYGRAYNPREREAHATFFNGSAARPFFPDPWPIEVAPRDLIASEFSDEDYMSVQELLDPSAEVDVPPAPEDPLREWEYKQVQHRIWRARVAPLFQQIWPDNNGLCLVPP